MRLSLPPDESCCQFVTKDGRRCRSRRLHGDHTLCQAHYFRARRHNPPPDPAELAAEILSPEEALNNPLALNSALTRLYRRLAAGRLTPRQATALAYVGQLILATLPRLPQEIPSDPAHAVLGSQPDEVLDQLVRTLHASVQQRPTAGSPIANEASTSAEDAGQPAQEEDSL